MELELIPILSIIFTVVAIAWEHFQVIGALKERLTRLETKMEPFWRIIEERLPKLLLSPKNLRKDALLEKMSKRELSKGEAVELKNILEKEFDSMASENFKVLTYTLVLARLEQIIVTK